MATYTWTAKDRHGNSVVKEISHDSAESARAALIAEGFTDLKLEEDELMATVRAAFKKPTTFLGENIEVTGADRLKVRQKPPPTFTRAFLRAIWQGKALIIAVLLIAAFEYYRGRTIVVWLLMAGLAVWIFALFFIGLPSVYYRKLHRADDWHRWDDVLAYVNILQGISKLHFIKIPQTALIRHRAKAIVGKGNLAAGLAEYKVCENQPGCPSWLYKEFVAGLYNIAEQHDTAMEWTRESLREKPRATGYLAVANRLLRYKRDTAGARAALAEAEQYALVEIAKPFLLRCQGIIAYLEGNYTEAKNKLETALDLVARNARRPYRDGNMAVTRAYLACTCARLRDLPAARKHLAEAREYLVATKETELLAECERELPT